MSVGDVVSWPDQVTGKVCKGTIQELHVDWGWREDSRHYCEADKIEFVRATIYRSARSVSADWKRCSELTLVSHGNPISKAAFKAAKARREQLKAERPFKPTKTHLIAYVISEAGHPMKRVDILRQVHEMEGSDIEFKESSNLDYFSANSAMHGSLLNRGLITITNGRGYSSKEALFALTAQGKQLVKEYRKWLGE